MINNHKTFFCATLLLLAITVGGTTQGETTLSDAAALLRATDYQQAVDEVLALPYDAAAVPQGFDTAFGPLDFPAAFPLTDTTTGTCCSGPVVDQAPLADLAPPFAEFPADFTLIELSSTDGTPLHAFAALHPGAPGIVVMHGFNTNGKYSIVRYGAALYANGYSVIMPDHRDMGREWARSGSYHPDATRHGQTLGWKEPQDLLVAARWLADAGVDKIGLLGFSEGAQNSIIAAGIDLDELIDATLTFSGPADQATQILRNPSSTSALLTTVVNNPDVCAYLTGVGAQSEFSATPNYMLRQGSAVDVLDGIVGAGVAAPGLHFYAQDDELVPSWNATILASRTNFMPNQHTVLIPIGNHAYFVDRYWTQLAALSWFRHWLDPDSSHTTVVPTVAVPLNGTPISAQQISLASITRADGDAELLDQDVCAAGAPTGPTAHLQINDQSPVYTFDGRRSYSGWEHDEIANWSIDAGDGTIIASGSSILDASVLHRFCLPGSYTVTLTVTDDSGRIATTQSLIEVTTTDTDADSIADCTDNCTLVSNPSQCDSDADGYGNHCDGDINNSGVVNFLDLSLLKSAFLTTAGHSGYDPNADLNCNDVINFLDLGMLKSRFLQPPGPSSAD